MFSVHLLERKSYSIIRIWVAKMTYVAVAEHSTVVYE